VELADCVDIVPTGLRFLQAYLGFRAALRLAAHDGTLAGPGEDTPGLTAEAIVGAVRNIQRVAEDQWGCLREVPTFFPGVLGPLETHCLRCVIYGWPDSALSITIPFVF